jgi:DivIVA domain-containing protein
MSTSSGYRRRPLSPHEIRNLRIRQIGFRKGYDPAEVEALLQRLAEEVAARDGRITALLTENERLQVEVYARRHGQLPANTAPELDEDLIAQRLQAQQYADEMLAAAQTSAAQLVSQSRQQANEILRTAHDAAERAVREYRANAGGSYTADREELTRLATLAQWAMRQLAGLRAQVDATDDAARLELTSILDRLGPILAGAAQPAAQADWLSPRAPQAETPQRATAWPPQAETPRAETPQPATTWPPQAETPQAATPQPATTWPPQAERPQPAANWPPQAEAWPPQAEARPSSAWPRQGDAAPATNWLPQSERSQPAMNWPPDGHFPPDGRFPSTGPAGAAPPR